MKETMKSLLQQDNGLISNQFEQWKNEWHMLNAVYDLTVVELLHLLIIQALVVISVDNIEPVKLWLMKHQYEWSIAVLSA